MKKALALIVLVAAAASCHNSYSSSEDFEDNRWAKDKVLYFDIDAPDKQEPATILLTYSHVADVQFTDIPVEVAITAPDGTKENIPLALHLKDKDGNDLSDCAGDICNLETVVKKIETPQPGDYKIEVRNKFNAPYLPNTLSVGVKFGSAD